MVPLTSCFIITLTWCRRWLITSAWKLSTLVSWSSSTLWALPGIQLNSWWVIPSLPSMIPVLIDHFIAFRSTQDVRVLCKPWDPCYPAFVLLYLGVLPSVNIKDVVRTAPPLKKFLVLRRFSPSPFFLGPRVASNRCTNKWTVLFEFCPSSKPLALKWNS